MPASARIIYPIQIHRRSDSTSRLFLNELKATLLSDYHCIQTLTDLEKEFVQRNLFYLTSSTHSIPLEKSKSPPASFADSIKNLDEDSRG